MAGAHFHPKRIIKTGPKPPPVSRIIRFGGHGTLTITDIKKYSGQWTSSDVLL